MPNPSAYIRVIFILVEWCTQMHNLQLTRDHVNGPRDLTHGPIRRAAFELGQRVHFLLWRNDAKPDNDRLSNFFNF